MEGCAPGLDDVDVPPPPPPATPRELRDREKVLAARIDAIVDRGGVAEGDEALLETIIENVRKRHPDLPGLPPPGAERPTFPTEDLGADVDLEAVLAAVADGRDLPPNLSDHVRAAVAACEAAYPPYAGHLSDLEAAAILEPAAEAPLDLLPDDDVAPYGLPAGLDFDAYLAAMSATGA